jgi:hypothetical protein
MGAAGHAYASCVRRETLARLALERATIDGSDSSLPPLTDVALRRHTGDHWLGGVSSGARAEIVFEDAP